MQLASSGVRALFGRRAVTNVSHSSHNGGHGANRSLHAPAVPRPQAAVATHSRSAAQTVINHTSSLFKAFCGHLFTPGTLRAPHPPGAATRSLYTGSAQCPSIQQRLSYTTRQLLGRPLYAPYLPRAPKIPGNVTHVGLGIARNFSTARPIFQDLVQNVPIATRAFLEGDWEFKLNEERQKRRVERANKKVQRKDQKKMLKAKEQEMSFYKLSKFAEESICEEPHSEELGRYFPAQIPEVTTYLLIPLAPTPSSRMPLPSLPSSSSAHPLLPYALIASLHNSHDTHALRVSSLFARLDFARVFDDPGVRCEARGDISGLCTILEVRFEGWEEGRVRGVLGEAGSGWCVVEELWWEKEKQERQEMEDVLEGLSDASVSMSLTEEESEARSPSPSSSTNPWSRQFDTGMPNIDIDPSTSFILPTLDFSASFPVQDNRQESSASLSYDWTESVSPVLSSPGLSDLAFHNAWASTEASHNASADVFSDAMSDSLSDISSPSFSPSLSPSPSRRSSSSALSESWVGFGFSSRFANMLEEDVEGPREALF